MKEQAGLDDLDEIRSDYKSTKAKLERYDTIIDNNQIAIIFLAVVIGIGGIVAASVIDNGRLARSALLYISLAVFPIAIIFAIITGARQSTKKKLEMKIEKLRREAALFQKHSTQPTGNITRSEIGLFEAPDKAPGSSHVAIGILVIVITLAVIIAPILIGQANANKAESERKEQQAQIERQRQEAQDKYYQQQQDALKNTQQNQNKPIHCVSNGIDSTVYTNCY